MKRFFHNLTAVLVLLLVVLALAQIARAADLAGMAQSSSGRGAQAVLTAADTLLVPGDLSIGTGNVTIDGSAGNITATGDVSVGGASALTGALTLDDGTGDSPALTLQDGDDKSVVLTKLDAGDATLVINEGGLELQMSNDTDDYLTVTTATNVPTIGTAGSCDLAITASSGEITFGDENLTVLGTLDLGADDDTSTLTVHDAATMVWYDDSDDTSVTIGPVANGTTTLGVTGSLDVSGSVAAGNITIDSGAITDASGTVDFDNETITTTGTVSAEQLTSTDDLTVTDDADFGSGNVTVDGSAGDITATGTVSAEQLTTTDDLTVTDDVDIGGGNLTIDGSAGSLAATGAVTWDGGVTVGKVTSQALLYDAFTDNTNTTGYLDISTQIPADTIVIGWKATVATGFTGDGSAAIQVGVAGDTDAFSADTAQSVYTSSTAVGAASLAASAFCDSATTARVTVTGGADFTSVSAGNMTVTIYYLDLE